ncbi:MAG: putative lipid II flippase FtsW [Gammaproteobacteria bacterium]|nr:putative lipid II flippase FtsW [Gammaproteobacteria bacterium]
MAERPFIVGRWHVDGVLVCLTLALIGLGLVMLASASVTISERELGQPFGYLYRQLLALGLGLGLAATCLLIPMQLWERFSFLVLAAALLLLVVVLLPGVGTTVNGATRWLRFGFVNLQVSEPARLLMIIYLAGYMVRRQPELAAGFAGFARPMVFVALAAVMLLMQPDFGAATVLLITAVALLFVGGARIRDFFLCAVTATAVLAALAFTTPYRLVRLTTFMDPWADPLDSGFQLTQSLIAIGRGEWFGVGLGSSVQKLFYLPEAHTDFVFAVLAEELGLVGVIFTVGLFAALVFRCFSLSNACARAERPFAAYVALGIGVWLGLQAFINIGVNMGLLPTKGLTLPLVSYGRSSMLVTLAAIGLLLRIHHELKVGEPEPPVTRAPRRRRRS